MVIYGTLIAIVCIRNHFLDIVLITGFRNVLPDGREEPESIIRTVCRMSGHLYPFRIVRSTGIAGNKVKQYQRKTTAVIYLCGQHERNLLLCHFGIQMDNTLNILNGITISITVSLSAVAKGCCARPSKGNKTLICIPGIYHAIECGIGSIDLEVHKLCMPVINQLLLLLLNHTQISIALQNLICHPGLCLTENKCQFFGLAGLQFKSGM